MNNQAFGIRVDPDCHSGRKTVRKSSSIWTLLPGSGLVYERDGKVVTEVRRNLHWDVTALQNATTSADWNGAIGWDGSRILFVSKQGFF